MTVNLSKLSLPHHRHGFETRQSSPRGMETAEAEPRPRKALDTPVVLLDDVVEGHRHINGIGGGGWLKAGDVNCP